jgi:tRNA threonylcarbamoyl adenosine modification protein YeaZ
MSGGGIRSRGLYVALDCSGPAGHVAVARGLEVQARVRLDRRGQHAGRVVPVIRDALHEAGADIEHLAGVVVGEGPGSFTGVRVGAATAKGLARARRVPLWPVSSLAATALAGWTGDEPGLRFVLFDARAERVYAACYGMGRAGMETLVPPHASELRRVLGSQVPPGAVFVGDAAAKHRAAIEGAGFEVEWPELGENTADGLIAFLRLHPDASPVASLETWEPRYLKASSAERAWSA